ncbi:MAG: hypothetical protein JWN40_161 [Phycisphaerales bacterium]|nr:hypothetical protein [Phycisphaerales bacterium]
MGTRLTRLAALFVFLLALTARSATPAPTPQKEPLPKYVKGELTEILDTVKSKGDYTAAAAAADACFDRVLLTIPATQTDVLRQADGVRRMIHQLSKMSDEDARAQMLSFLRANEELAQAVAFLIPADAGKDEYALLDKLRKERPKQVVAYANLAAAICAVHAKPFERHTNENTSKAADPIAIFDYYIANEKQMFFGVKNVPAELLAWVVDTTASIEEMQWALNKYAGDPAVGARFFDIKYDYAAFKTGAPKKLTQEGFNLQNIVKYGGVCADQAYFAMTVGKSIGVPTAYATGAAGEAGHAWVGFLQARRGQGWWNFNEGRYEAYQGVVGNVQDPLTRKRIPDAYVSLLAELIGTKPADRQAARALEDSALRLLEIPAGDVPTIVTDQYTNAVVGILPKPRSPGVVAALDRLELAVKSAPGDRYPWLDVAKLAADGKLNIEQKRKWSDNLQRVCGAKYPDFTLAVLDPMIRSMDSDKEQYRLWEAVLPLFKTRGDLTASIKTTQAQLLEKQNQTEQAGVIYMEIIQKYADAGPFVLPALQKAEDALVALKRNQNVPQLYAIAWAATKPPRSTSPDIAAQSNWSKIGKLLEKKLEAAGKTEEAERIKRDMQSKVSG